MSIDIWKVEVISLHSEAVGEGEEEEGGGEAGKEKKKKELKEEKKKEEKTEEREEGEGVEDGKWSCIFIALFQSTDHSKHFKILATFTHTHSYIDGKR